MATLRELKTRIGSVASSEKITGAMKMISSAKVHKFERSLRELLPFKNQIQTIMGHILSAGVEFHSPLIVDRGEVKKIGVVVYGSDDGLCGAYNLNIFKQLLVEINSLKEKHGNDVSITLYPVGKKILKACLKIEQPGKIDVKTIAGVDSKMDGKVVDTFTENLREAFSVGELDLVEVVYMRYISIARQRLTVDQLFPVRADLLLAGDSTTDENQLYIFEPDANDIFNAVLPMFVISTMQEITIENRASEQAARVMAMQSANDNAHKLQEQLQLEYNKLRQQSITTELLDILGGQVER
ncbi:MAG: ATP synthase F1 subunit gamma [Muribaculaceae bacterium]|nr:ATP synthase F1 subunit gamma [Muribaculaceae bacterium]